MAEILSKLNKLDFFTDSSKNFSLNQKFCATAATHQAAHLIGHFKLFSFSSANEVMIMVESSGKRAKFYVLATRLVCFMLYAFKQQHKFQVELKVEKDGARFLCPFVCSSFVVVVVVSCLSLFIGCCCCCCCFLRSHFMLR